MGARRKPSVSYLHVFGCLAFIKELNNVSKLDDRSSLGVFICYAEGVKAYRMLDSATRHVRVAHNVISMKTSTGHRPRLWMKTICNAYQETNRPVVVVSLSPYIFPPTST